jgi:acyl-CoA dehydrogenase
MRKVAAFLFGYMGPRRKELADIAWDDVDYRLHPAG